MSGVIESKVILLTLKLYFTQQFKTKMIVLFLAFLRDGDAREGPYVKSV